MQHILLEYDKLYNFASLKKPYKYKNHIQYNLILFNNIFGYDYISLYDKELIVEIGTYLNSLNEDNMHFIDLM